MAQKLYGVDAYLKKGLPRGKYREYEAYFFADDKAEAREKFMALWADSFGEDVHAFGVKVRGARLQDGKDYTTGVLELTYDSMARANA